MNEQIHNEILKIEAKGLSDIELLALVTDSSYEVVFYAKHDGKLRQGNDLAECGILPLNLVDEIYAGVAKGVRADKKYDISKLNIVKVSGAEITFEYDERNCKIYGLKKSWKAAIGV